MALTGPDPISTNPLKRVAFELQTERRARGGYPPGDNVPSLRRTHRMIVDPLRLLLEGYERHGPVFSLRILNARNVFMLGPEANHFMLVSNADEVPLARRRLRRPDPAARRRDAHDRRRLPQAVAPDHAPGLPPRAREAAIGVMEEEVERRARAVARRPRARPLRVGARARAAGRDARAVRLRPRPAGERHAPARASSSARSASTAASTGCRSCAGRGRRGPR